MDYIMAYNLSVFQKEPLYSVLLFNFFILRVSQEGQQSINQS